MIEMTLSSRHRIPNSSPGGLRPSTLHLGHGGSPRYRLSHVDGEETLFVFLKPPRPGTEPRTLALNAAVLTTTLGPPPWWDRASGRCVVFIEYSHEVKGHNNTACVLILNITYPENTLHWQNAVAMRGRRFTRWPSIGPMFVSIAGCVC